MKKNLNSAIKKVTLGNIYPEAYSVLAKSFEESYDYMKKIGFKSDPYFKQNFSKISKRTGLLDAWLLLVLLGSYSAGFAAGKGRKKIKPEDIKQVTKKTICDKWPQCGGMALGGFVESLSLLMEWYDTLPA